MTTSHDMTGRQAKPSQQAKPRARRLVSLTATIAVVTSACGALPFGGDDGGQDIASVEVRGLESGDTVLNDPVLDDPVLDGTETDDQSDAGQSDDDQLSATRANDTTTVPTDTSQADPDGVSNQPSTEATTTVDDRFVGRSVDYLSTDLALGTITTTTQRPDDFLKGVDGELDVPVVLVEVTATSRDGVAVTFPEALFGLVDASGARFAPLDTFDRRGDRMFAIGVEAQATTQFVLVFPETDLDGASFVISEAGLVPGIIPLTDTDTTQPSPYSFDLGAPTELMSVTAPGINDTCDLAMDVELQSATAVLEGNDSHRFERTALGERFIDLDLAITNRNEPDVFSVCGSGFSPYQLEPRLEVNGVSLAPVNPIEFDSIEIDATRTSRFVFRIDTGPSDLRLVSLNGDLIAEWSVDIPPVAGE